MPKSRLFSRGDSRGDSQQSSGPGAKKKVRDFLRANKKLQEMHSAGGGGDVGNLLNGESESSMQKFEAKNMQNPDNAQTNNTTKKVYKRQYSTGKKKSRRKQNNQRKTSKKGKMERIVRSELEEIIEDTRFDGSNEKIHRIYEITEKSSKHRFERVKRLIDSKYEIEVTKESTQKMAESKKDIWQSVLSRKKEQPIQGLVFKLDSPDLYRSNREY